jgi:DNA repair protein RadC
MGENSAVLLKLMVPVIRLYMKEKTDGSKKRRFTLEGLAEFLNARYMGYTKEVFAITTLDNNGGLIGFDIVAEGDVGTVGVQTRVVVENVIKRNATYVVLSHNHPGGKATPSAADIKTTENLTKALRAINVYVLDHIILCDDDWVSLAISKDYKHLFN